LTTGENNVLGTGGYFVMWIIKVIFHVAPLRKKTAKEVGRGLVRIMFTPVILEILQCDNDCEFLGKCICKGVFQDIKNCES
jgi:hypothetical protein